MLRARTFLLCLLAAAGLTAAACTPPPDPGPANQPPVANFEVQLGTTAGTVGRAPNTVTFVDNSGDPDGEIVNWSWNFGNGQTSVGTETNPQIVYGQPGVYTVRLTVTDDRNAIATTEQVVTITGAPAPTGLTQPQSDCGGFLATHCDVTVAWNPVVQVSQYQVEFDTANIVCPGSNQLHLTTATQLSTRVCKSVLANAFADVYWKVRAQDSVTGLWGPWSARIQVNN